MSKEQRSSKRTCIHVKRRFDTLLYARSNIGKWFLNVYVIGAFPIGLHIYAGFINNSGIDDLRTAMAGDAYLYTFIITLAGFFDSLSENKQILTISFVVAGFVASVGNFSCLVTSIATSAIVGPGLRFVGWALLVAVFLVYSLYKLFVFYGIAYADLRAQEASGTGGEGS